MQNFYVYLASKTEQENQILSRKLDVLEPEFPGLRFISLHPQGLASSVAETMAVVVINVQEWNRSEAISLVQLREAGYRGQVLVMAKANATAAVKSLQAMDGVVFLEKPFEAKDLIGIVRKMLTERAVAQRVHRRYNTNESAEVELYGRSDRFLTKVHNMSKGGAYLEFQQPTALKVGDMVRVKVELKDVNRIYTMPARVVWTSRAASVRGGIGAGVEFIGTPDVKKTILKSF